MQVKSVSGVNFQAKDYYLSNQARVNANKLLQMMNKNNKYKLNSKKTGWQVDILSSVSTGKNVRFTDTRYYLQNTDDIQKNANTTDFTMRIGKNWLNVNGKTGKILSFKTGVFTSLSRVISKAEKYIDFFLENFENSDVVKQHRFGTVIYK